MVLGRLKLFYVLASCLILAISCTKKENTAEKENTGKKIKVGFIYIGAVGDSGWTYTHDQARKAVEALPFVEQTTYVENVPGGADAVRLMTNLAERGYSVIFANSYSHMDAMYEVAQKYPNVIFMNCAGYKTAANMGTYFGRIEEARYLSGVIAGKMTKKNEIGYVAAYSTPEVVRGINAFTLGAMSVNPKVKVRVVWTNTWYDPALERSAAENLISIGVDLITMHQDTPAVIQAARDHNIMAIGYNSDMSKYAPSTFLTAPVWNWDKYYIQEVEKAYRGEWKPSQDMWGLKEGMVGLAAYGPMVKDEIKSMIEAQKQEMLTGKISPFQGPIYDQNGNLKAKAGEELNEQILMSMKFFVNGVVGNVN